MKASNNCINLIKKFEGFSAKACKCVSTEKYYTIGYGHYGADVKEDQTITKTEATKLLKSDVAAIAKNADALLSKWYPCINQNQFDALVSFSYNCGISNLKKLAQDGTRTLLQISEKLPAYNKSGGKVLEGLTNRRKMEQELFNTKVINDTSTGVPYTVKIVCDLLYIRNGPGTNYKVNGSVNRGYIYTIVDESNGYGKLKSGAGWISLNSRYVTMQGKKV